MYKPVKISDLPCEAPQGLKKNDVEKEREEMADAIGEMQRLLYAEAKRSLLVIFQGMDAAGKDGTAGAVFRWCVPHGISAYSFKKPTPLELAHDFLWRAHVHTPEKGYIKIFNRSYYEDVLIQRVHRWFPEEHFELRFKAINAFEELLSFDAHTTIIKFFLNISEKRQGEKLRERLVNPKKQWKHNAGDWEERKHWGTYMACYEDVINKSVIPWHVIPADDEWYRNYCATKVVYDTLKAMDPQRPVLSAPRHD
ncbi:MAG: polyphosphate kinase [Saprospiraceae bacterium]|nr:polyphosphate kinase [Saprospiraceae bacterium]